MSDLPRKDEDIGRTVDEFLADALAGDRKQFPSDRPKEWVDEERTRTQAAPPLVPGASGLTVVGAAVNSMSRFEPPLVRLRCTGCGNKWDSWVDDAGALEDTRDTVCHCQKGQVVLAEPE